MTLAPLLAASAVVQFHAAAAIVALLTGIGVLLRQKGTPAHTAIGRCFVAAMGLAAITSFWITGLVPGHYSAIHILSVVTLVTLPIALWRRRVGDIRGHATSMILNFIGVLVAGAFTLAPARIFGRVFFGP